MTRPSSFADTVRSVHTSLGGRATAQQVATIAAEQISDETYKDLTWRGFVSQIAAALRARDAVTGLPEAPCIDGTYVQQELLTSDELRRLAVDASARGAAFIARARGYADRHLALYGVAIDPATGQSLAS